MRYNSSFYITTHSISCKNITNNFFQREKHLRKFSVLRSVFYENAGIIVYQNKNKSHNSRIKLDEISRK